MQRICAFATLLSAVVFVVRAPAQEHDLREAARLDQQGRCEEAEPYYQQALASGEPSPALLNNVGNHYLICGQPAKAKLYFERLVKISPGHTNASLQLARIAVDQRQGAAALSHLARVSDSNPAILMLRAEALHWSGKQAEALAVVREIESGANGDPRVLFTLGLTCARIGLYDRAEEAFSAVVLKFPGHFDALLNLGRAAARAEHYDRAQRALETALKVRPGDADALFELGRAHAARQNSSRAVYLLAQARQQAPQRPDILLALARAAEDAEYYGDAALAYDEYLQQRPDDDIVRRDRARVYGFTTDRQEQGIAELVSYQKKHPDDPVALFYLAQLTWESEPEKALDALSKALDLKPEYAVALSARAWLFNRLGRSDEALRDLEAAVKASPDAPQVLDQLGLAYLNADRLAEAESALRRALELSNGDHPEVLLHLGRTLMSLGQRDEARKLIEQFQKVRPATTRGPKKEPGMIEAATLSTADLRKREIARLRRDAQDHPDDPELQFHLAEQLLSDGQLEEALSEFRTLLTRNLPADLLTRAGAALLRAEHPGLAAAFLSRAREDPIARLDLAIAWFESKGPDQALEALAAAPPEELQGDYLLMRARILDAAGRDDEAEDALRQGLLHATTHPLVAQQAALLLVRRHREAEALAFLEKAVGRMPGDPGLLLLRGVALALDGKAPAAEQALKLIQLRWPEWDRPYLAHGLLLESMGDLREAGGKLETVVALGSEDRAARCALDRISGSVSPKAGCECGQGLYEWLTTPCALP